MDKKLTDTGLLFSKFNVTGEKGKKLRFFGDVELKSENQ